MVEETKIQIREVEKQIDFLSSFEFGKVGMRHKIYYREFEEGEKRIVNAFKLESMVKVHKESCEMEEHENE